MEKNHAKNYMMETTARPKIIVVTGAESTGKTVLTSQLGQHFSSPFYPEYAREYLEKRGTVYTFEDVENIARVQQAQMKEAVQLTAAYVFFDTWLIITKIWMEVVYGKVPAWITEEISNAPVDLFLLCKNDIPWIPDPLRENGGEMRQKLFENYRKNLTRYRLKFRIVSGTGELRLKNALRIIRENC